MTKQLDKFRPTREAMEKRWGYVSGSCAIVFADCMFESWDFRDDYICLAFSPEVAPIAKATAMLYGIPLVDSTQYWTDLPYVLLDMTDRYAITNLAKELVRSSQEVL